MTINTTVNTVEEAERAALPVLQHALPTFEAYTHMLMGWWSLGNRGLFSKSDHKILQNITERTRNKLEKIERRLVIRERAQAAGHVRIANLTDAELLRFRDPE